MADNNPFSLKFATSFITSQVDNTKFQCNQFMTKEVAINQEKFLKFNFKTECFDSLLYQFVAVNADYSDLWKAMKVILITTHGQSFTEQGFGINKLTSDVNMEGESLIAQKVIYDAMNSTSAVAGSFPIAKETGQLQESLSDRS